MNWSTSQATRPGKNGYFGRLHKKAVRRIYRQAGLKVAQVRANPKPRLAHGQDQNACHLRPSRGKDDVWTRDFIFDRTSDGRSRTRSRVEPFVQ